MDLPIGPGNRNMLPVNEMIPEDDPASSDSEAERRSAKMTESPEQRRVTIRRQQNAIFKEFIRDTQKHIFDLCTKAEIDDEMKSAARLVQESEQRRIITSPREYQLGLFERAKEKNIIAVLNTGFGKTLIAALLLGHTITRELEDRRMGKRHQLSFFLVDKAALVFQQHGVLTSNLDHPVAMFCGSTLKASADREFWKEICAKNMVVVCTAEILYACLFKGFVKMEQINLLVFDEAHHAKKQHAYARIMKEYYAKSDPEMDCRPRIFGMTASPVDAKTNVEHSSAQLEAMLQSEIATVYDPAAFAKASLHKPVEKVVEYTKASVPFTTVLWQKLFAIVGENRAFDRYFAFSKVTSTELGRWCADRFWKLALTEEKATHIERRTGWASVPEIGQVSPEALDDRQAAVGDARRTVQEHHLPEPQMSLTQLSHKVLKLVEILRDHFDQEKGKCIIFVEKRFTALLLADFLSHASVGLPFVRAGKLLGAGSADEKELHMTYREQVLTIKSFRDGDLNCLVATSIAEEGLDIPDCNMIIRFDLYKTMIQYIQSRGRARHKDSKFFHMVELGNQTHSNLIFECTESEQKLEQLCQTLPKDRIISGSDYDLDYFLGKEKTRRSYTIKSSGAKLTYNNSLQILNNFISTLPHAPELLYLAEYTVRRIGKEYQCEVILPDGSPIRCAIGNRCSSKIVAKCSAAFSVCLELIKAGHLDEHLQSTMRKKLPAMRNAQLAISSRKRSSYPMKVKPDIWGHHQASSSWFITILKLSTPESLERPSRPLGILTRLPLPQVTPFPLFFADDKTSNVECIPFTKPISLSTNEVRQLNEFSLRIFWDIFSKKYKPESTKMPYFFAPLVISHDSNLETSSGNPHSLIDWSCAQLIEKTEKLDWEHKPDDMLQDRFVTDPWDGSRKFWLIRRREDLKPTDPQLPGLTISKRNRKQIRHGSLNIWDFSVSLFSKSRARITVRNDIPVAEAVCIPFRRNLLDNCQKDEEKGRLCYLVLQTLNISALPVDIVAMAYNIPAIIYRLESNLIAIEGCKMLGLDINPSLALEAFTKDSDNTGEHDEDKINFQRGMGKNYERLEFLGDAFLKMSTTVALYTQIPNNNEYEHHVYRMVLICNINLFNNALKLNLEEYIRSKAFSRRTWYPNTLELLQGKQTVSKRGKNVRAEEHTLGDKTIADVCEAIIGAAYMTTYEERSFDMAVRAVTKFTNHENHQMMAYSEYYSSYKPPDWQLAPSTREQLRMAEQIEAKLGYKFEHPRLLRCAFTHPSYGTIYERIPDYQRLEFLGDALLDMVCVDYLFQRYPSADPQWLTEHKMPMVSNEFLSCLCVSLGLHRHMICLSSSDMSAKTEYVQIIMAARELAETEAVAANLPPAAYARNYWIDVCEKPPKCLADIVESYIGAVFVDSKFDFGQVRSFFDKHIRPFFEDMRIYDEFANKSPVRALANLMDQTFCCRNWRFMADEISDEGLPLADAKVLSALFAHGRIQEYTIGASERYAKIAMAKKCLQRWEKVTVQEFKAEVGCDFRKVIHDSSALRPTAGSGI